MSAPDHGEAERIARRRVDHNFGVAVGLPGWCFPGDPDPPDILDDRAAVTNIKTLAAAYLALREFLGGAGAEMKFALRHADEGGLVEVVQQFVNDVHAMRAAPAPEAERAELDKREGP